MNAIVGLDAGLVYDRELLDEQRRLRLYPAAVLRSLLGRRGSEWANSRGRYGLPTTELVDFLRKVIDGRSAIEVGAGMGDLGVRLGIPMTDSYIQTTPEMQAYYAALGARITTPPPDVEKLEALEAVRKYKPKVVIASWLTQAYEEGDDGPVYIGSSVYGPDERVIIRECETYVHIGNINPHKDKRAFALPHKLFQPDGLVSKAVDQSKNAIWIWGPHGAA